MSEIIDGVDLTKTFDIVKTMKISVNKAASTVQGATTVAHGLSYKPAYLAFFLSNSATPPIYYQTPYVYLNSATGACPFKADIVTDEDTVNCYIITPSGESLYTTAYPNAVFYVFLLRQPVLL